MKIRVLPDYEALSQALADALVQAGEAAVAARGRFLLALNGGGTPQRLFDVLGSQYREFGLWKAADVFWGDERCVPPDAVGSCYRQAREAFLDFCGIPLANVHRIRGELSPSAAAADYYGLLAGFGTADRPWPVFDLALLGIGEDGHTASLFPGQPTGEPGQATLAVTAHYQDRPANRVSLTPSVFNSSRRIFVMASGVGKAGIVYRVLQGEGEQPTFPIRMILRDHATLWLDEAAASGI